MQLLIVKKVKVVQLGVHKTHILLYMAFFFIAKQRGHMKHFIYGGYVCVHNKNTRAILTVSIGASVQGAW